MKTINCTFAIVASVLSIFAGCSKNGGTSVVPVPDTPGGGGSGDDPTPVEKFTQTPLQSYSMVSPEDLSCAECYFLSLLHNLPELKAVVAADETLSAIESAKFSRLSNSTLRSDRLDALCFTSAEIQQVGDHLASLWEKGNVWDRLVSDHLSPSGCYYYTTANSASELLRLAFKHDAEMVAKIVAVYGKGTQAAHCDNDTREATDADIDSALSAVLSKTSATEVFGDIALSGMYNLLKVNEFNEEPVLFEPLASGRNKAACDAVKSTDFSRFSYSAIVVLGASNDQTCFADEAKVRCDYAYTKYRAKKAPFVIVTGGRVRPFKTKDNEAALMKAYLIEKGVPESVIIMEPHARHTPTNFRNVSRVLFRYGFPFEKEALMVMQTGIMKDVMETQAFRQRCTGEFGFMPVTFSSRLDDYSMPFLPSLNSLTIGSIDPLDP